MMNSILAVIRISTKATVFIIAAIVFFVISGFLIIHPDEEETARNEKPPFLKGTDQWVDSVYKSLSFDEKIAQLFMIAAYSDRGDDHVEELSKLIKEYNIGGLIFMQGTVEQQARLTNYYQKESKTPLMIAMDAEWGPSQRLFQLYKLPNQMTLGGIQNHSLIYDYGKEIARQLKRLGVHVNFAPVVDINSNPDNPIISVRSFGEDKKAVTRKAFAYMSGLQDNKIIAVAKHFPGHGDTDSDSHKTLPVINHSLNRLKTTELYPFKELIKTGVGGIMVAHLYIPALDTTENLASTLSPKIVTDLLKKDMQFKGLVFTDALNMKGVTKYWKEGEVDVKALLAGNDVLLFSQDVPKAIDAIKKAVKAGEISKSTINRRCKKILKAKSWVGLNNYKPVKLENILSDLNSGQAKLVNRNLTEKAITLLKNENDIIPLKRINNYKTVSIAINKGENDIFQNTLNLYKENDLIAIPGNVPKARFESLQDICGKYDLAIVSIYSNQRSPANNYGIPDNVFDFIDSLSSKTNVILSVFASPYILKRFRNIDKIKSIVMAYEDNPVCQHITAQIIYGGVGASGRSPVTISDEFPLGAGMDSQGGIRLRYSIPEKVGIDHSCLFSIDSIVEDAIKEKAFPGCQLLIARKGIVFYNKAYGYQTYDNINHVKTTDIYDLASITKMVSTVSALMMMYDEGKLNLNKVLGDYLPYLDSTNKENMKILDVLTHQARLTPWIPFWIKTIKDTSIYHNIYSKKPKDGYLQVADNMYIKQSYKDSMYQIIADSKLWRRKEYKYSDIGFYLMQQIVENYYKERIDSLVERRIFAPLGASTLGFLPKGKFPDYRLIPTEDDKKYRMQLIRGYVHDPGAAMLGGVAGHAGLFSSANDLAKYMQMLIDKGEYGGKRFFSDTTIQLFTSCPYCNKKNRRGIGFDKPQMNYKIAGPTCQCISGKSFGHTGFTGTIAWADPDKEVVFIFLSNRIHPDEENKKLIKMDVRTKIMEQIYACIEKENGK